MIDKLKAGISKLAAVGAVRRRGLGGLQAYGGTVAGKGHIISKETGKKTKIKLDGGVAAKN